MITVKNLIARIRTIAEKRISPEVDAFRDSMIAQLSPITGRTLMINGRAGSIVDPEFIESLVDQWFQVRLKLEMETLADNVFQKLPAD